MAALKPRQGTTDAVFAAAAVLVTLYGGLLRFEALSIGYGWAGQPEWARALERHALPAARVMRPAEVRWSPITKPYVGGDPINYIRYAREMRSFYQAHVREPVFLAVTRFFLWLTGGRDIAVSYASALGGTLAVLGTYLLGSALASPLVGLAAALALATEFEAITWSADGWRDDTFMLFVALAAWSLVRLRQQPTTGRAVAAGAVAAAACLTRISALSFVVPALLWLALAEPGESAAKVRRAVLAASLVAAALIAPYLINCWRQFGDPLHALNYHARYYRHAEGLPPDESVGALEYAWSKVEARPVATADTALQGLVTVPFSNKWRGWRPWGRAVGPILRWCAAAGVVVALFTPPGRLLLLILVASLLPYALTWSLGGGGEWRFTQHVYPLYLVLAFHALSAIVRAVVDKARERSGIGVARGHVLRGAAAAAAVLVLWGATSFAPLLVVREALAAGEAVTITAGERDEWFFTGDWSQPLDYGNVAVRVAQAEVVGVRLPLAPRTYVMTLRIDPPLTADRTRQPRLTIFLNKQELAALDLTRDPHRVGSYRLRVPRELVQPLSRLEVLASHTVPAGEAGAPFDTLAPHTPVAFRLWYLRLEAE